MFDRTLPKRSSEPLECARAALYWRSAHDHLYALELADLGRGRPSTGDRLRPLGSL